jgi:hypothetical protein
LEPADAAILFPFFRNRSHLFEDYEGEDLADLAAVQETAMASAKEIIAEGLLGGRPVLADYRFEVHDEAGSLLLAFPFAEAEAKLGSAR